MRRTSPPHWAATGPRDPTRTEASLVLAELCGNAGGGGKSRRELEGAVPRLV